MKIKSGDKYSKIFAISESMINHFAVITGDNNPIHLDDGYAKTTIFKGRIAQGFLVGSLISSILGNDYPGNGTIYIAQNLKFINPVYIDDKIEVIIEVISVSKNKCLKLKTLCKNQDGIIVINGDATVIAPKNCELIF